MLKRALELRTGEEWEVIDASVPGGFSSFSLGTLAHDGIQFRPDVVTTLNGINDILVLDERTMLRMGEGLFKHSIYHTDADRYGQIFDPRTGAVQRPGILDQLASKSALVQVVSKSRLIAAFLRSSPPRAPVAPPPTSAGYSTSHPEQLDIYVNNQLAMSYLAEGSGAKFVGFLHPTCRSSTRCWAMATGPSSRRQEPRTADVDGRMVFRFCVPSCKRPPPNHASFDFVDLSLMFIHEQAFADLAHLKYESDREERWQTKWWRPAWPRKSSSVVSADRACRTGAKLHIEGTPHDWNEQGYLAANPDVAAWSPREKFRTASSIIARPGSSNFGSAAFPAWNESAYLADNPDVVPLIGQGLCQRIRALRQAGQGGRAPQRPCACAGSRKPICWQIPTLPRPWPRENSRAARSIS